MNKKQGPRLFFFLLLVLTVSSAVLYHYRYPLTNAALEFLLNQNMKEFFDGSIRLSGARIDVKGRLWIDRFDGNLAAEAGILPLEIREIRSENTLFHYFLEEGLRLNFKSLRPSNSAREGVDGTLRIRGGKDWLLELKTTVRGIDLEDVILLNPEFLAGSKGTMKGEMMLHARFNEDPRGSVDLYVEKPGGKLQSQFFEGIFPYLPKSVAKAQVKKLSNRTELVDFDNAKLQVDIARADRIKVFLHILIPDYNLNLNLNMEVRVDDKEVLRELLQIMGVIKIRVPS